MKNYQIIYNEVITHSFEVEAKSEEKAKAKFQKMLENGELDFSTVKSPIRVLKFTKIEKLVGRFDH